MGLLIQYGPIISSSRNKQILAKLIPYTSSSIGLLKTNCNNPTEISAGNDPNEMPAKLHFVCEESCAMTLVTNATAYCLSVHSLFPWAAQQHLVSDAQKPKVDARKIAHKAFSFWRSVKWPSSRYKHHHKTRKWLNMMTTETGKSPKVTTSKYECPIM